MYDIDNELENDLELFEEQEEVIQKPAGEEILEPDDLFAETPQESKIPTLPIVDELLKAKGITDGSITIIGEDDKEEKVNFYNLTTEEQLEILNAEIEEQEEEKPSFDLQDAEKEFFENLRKENLTIEQYLEKYKADVVSEVSQAAEKSYDIDAYGDEDIFLLDLKSKYDLTDEELAKELEKELTDKELFQKKVTKIREEYKELEDLEKKSEQERFAAEQEQQYGQFVETMVDVAVNTPDFYGIELDDDEKNEVLSYLLETDDAGATEFAKAINTPEKLYEAAWFLKYGKDAFDALTDAYETEIKKLKEDKPKPHVVIKKKKDEEIETGQYMNIDDLF